MRTMSKREIPLDSFFHYVDAGWGQKKYNKMYKFGQISNFKQRLQ